jgi:hypothetical protein
MPPDVLQTLPGYGSDIEKNRADARHSHAQTRLRARQPAQDQGVGARPPILAGPSPRVMRKDYIVVLTGAGSGPDPDQNTGAMPS